MKPTSFLGFLLFSEARKNHKLINVKLSDLFLFIMYATIKFYYIRVVTDTFIDFNTILCTNKLFQCVV